MQANIPAARQRIIDKLAQQAVRARRRGFVANAAQIREFIQTYYHGVPEEDLGARRIEDLAGAALWHLQAGAIRRPGTPFVHLFNPDPATDGFGSSHTVLAVVTKDMPFLVDSLSALLSQSGIGVHFLAHPIFSVRRDGRGKLLELGSKAAGQKGALVESWQWLELDRLADVKALESLRGRILEVLDDVHWATADWEAMRARARDIAASLQTKPGKVPASEAREAQALLHWMEDNHFTFLGYGEYRLKRGRGSDVLEPLPNTGLGLLNPRRSRRRTQKFTTLSGEARDYAREPSLLIITKANTVSTVHRATYLDYLCVKTFDAAGRVTGERRFLGLWTSSAYSSSPREIPVLRTKVEQVISHFGLAPTSHDGKAVLHVLESYPRDELFQTDNSELVRTVRDVVNLYERPQVRLFVRRDAFRRFYSCLIFIPRDHYSTDVRQRIEAILRAEYAATALESQVQLTDAVMARLHVLVRTEPFAPARKDKPRMDTAKLEKKIAAAVRTWKDRLKEVLLARHDEETALRLFDRYADCFPPAYQAAAADAPGDIACLEALSTDDSGLRISLQRDAEQPPANLHLRLFRRASPISISEVLPLVENMGLKVISERPYDLKMKTGTAWIQDFELEHRGGLALDLKRVSKDFQETFAKVWLGAAENDGFNKLVLTASLSWRETAVLRAYCRYLLQTGLPFSQAYMEQVLAANAQISGLLSRQFQTLFDPAKSPKWRANELARVKQELDTALNAVKSQDEDRILRAFAAVIGATLRTNYFQSSPPAAASALIGAQAVDGQPYLSFKLDPEKVPGLPLPRPMFEIFVYSPRVEGVHLRKGRVARGGIRWSDRREDFRTEVLGLMKAQNVKNTVIVPVGAKGGFVPKRLPTGGNREEIQREVVACYQIFIRGLLDLTDNIVNNKIAPPRETVRRDADDPYLVVAADKGTATFSDIANAISLDHGFWLGDAFASGGSAGYDHKKMAITARGAWECVKRHFRELGVDTQKQDFTVAGIGDMAGDVFGNGMLQSPHIRLLAAFNHQHIFIDPNPNAAASFKERQRLFALPRSSWEDYNRKLISKGGGIYSRASKSITLSGEAQALLGFKGAATSQEIIRAILRMPVDLLWNGGIGTYVKAASETHVDIGDRSNDALRVNGSELQAKVIGEGGNLGFSQLGRVEYALKGGRINTDFIDNSAGVNCSDVEVNIKILLNGLMQAGRLKLGERNQLLARMTGEVADLVLRNNYLQSQALSTLQVHAAERFSEHAYVVRALTQSGDLDPAIEFLPNEEQIAERRKLKKGFTRPELAILLSYSKIWLYNKLIQSDVPEDPYLSKELERYFPEPIRRRYGRHLNKHRLRREIIATAITNSLVNRMGPVFALRAQEDTGAEAADIARAYTIAREVFAMRDLWTAIEKLDNVVPAQTQYAMMYQTSRLLRHMTYRFLQHREADLHIEQTVSRLAPGVQRLARKLQTLTAGEELARYKAAEKQLTEAFVPASIASRIAALPAMHSAVDIVQVAQETGIETELAGRIYFLLGERLKLDWMRERVEALGVDGHWQAVARGTLRDNLYALQRQLTAKVLARRPSRDPSEVIDSWLSARKLYLQQIERTVTDMRTTVAADFPTLSVALQAVRRLVEN